MQSHTIYGISMSVGSFQISHPSQTYGVSFGCNTNNAIPSTVSYNTPISSDHIFHSDEYIIEAMTAPNYLGIINMRHLSYSYRRMHSPLLPPLTNILLRPRIEFPMAM